MVMNKIYIFQFLILFRQHNRHFLCKYNLCAVILDIAAGNIERFSTSFTNSSVLAILVDDPSCLFELDVGPTSLKMVVGPLPHSATMTGKLFRSLRATPMEIHSLNVKCKFLFMVFFVFFAAVTRRK